MILIVEDDLELLDFIESYFLKLHYRIIAASNGIEGLNLARKFNPDLIVLDVNLPKLNGFTVCRLLKFDENFKHIPVIIWTWRDLEEDREMSFKSGANRYMKKSQSLNELQIEVENLIGVS